MQNHLEFNALLFLRQHQFPWNKYLNTTLAVGIGPSYATEIPEVETVQHDKTSQILNCVILEFTLAHPKKFPRWDFVTRIHHRAGAFRVFLSDSCYGAAPDNDAMIYRMLNYVSSGIVPPSSPSNVSATFSDSSITVTWAAPQPGTYPIGGYAIYKGTSSGGESLTPISTVGATVTTWTDTSVVLGSTYYYYIKAYDTGSPPNYSTPSGEVTPYQVAGAIRDDGMVPAESAQLPGVPNIGI